MWSHMVMTHIKIAQLKSHLSAYLRQVQKGEKIVVTDRDTPIAQVIPYTAGAERLHIVSASTNPSTLKKIKIKPAPQGTDSLNALLEDRKDDLDNH